MNHFPKLLSSQIGFDVAETLLEGFDRHYCVFRDAAIAANAMREKAGKRVRESPGSEWPRTQHRRLEEDPKPPLTHDEAPTNAAPEATDNTLGRYNIARI